MWYYTKVAKICLILNFINENFSLAGTRKRQKDELIESETKQPILSR